MPVVASARVSRAKPWRATSGVSPARAAQVLDELIIAHRGEHLSNDREIGEAEDLRDAVARALRLDDRILPPVILLCGASVSHEVKLSRVGHLFMSSPISAKMRSGTKMRGFVRAQAVSS